MPEAIPLIVEILTGAAAATSIGTSIYSATNQPGTPKPAVPAVSSADAAKTKQNQIASLSQQFPGIQAATGGSLSPEAWIRLSELLTSQAGTPGIDAAGQDLMKKLSSSGLTTGSTYG